MWNILAIRTRTSLFIMGVSTLFIEATALCQNPEANSTFRVSINRDLHWVRSGAWDKSGSRIFLVDVGSGELAGFSLFGDYLPDFSIGHKALRRHFSQIQSTESGYILEDKYDSTLILLDSALDLRSASEVSLIPERNPDGPEPEDESFEISTIYRWTYFDDQFLTFSDIDQGEAEVPQWVSGFLRVPRDQPKDRDFALSLTLSLGDQMRRFYLLGIPFLTAWGGRGYILVMDSSPYIVEFSKETHRLYPRSSLGHCNVRQELPPNQTLSAVTDLKNLETISGPMGLYAQADSLYILCREAENHPQKWSLLQIDRHNGQLLSVKPLLTTAINLVVVPGPTYWAFIEMGSVGRKNGKDYMPVKSVLYVDSNSVNLKQSIVIGLGEEPVDIIGIVRISLVWLLSGIGGTILLKVLWRRGRGES